MTSLSLCKTRPASGRPLKHRKRKVEKSLQKAREKIEAAGGTWIPAVPYEEHKAARTHVVGTHITQQEAAEKVDVMGLQWALTGPIHDADNVNRDVQEIIKKEQALYIVRRDGWPRLP